MKDRVVCTKEQPWDGKTVPAKHPEAISATVDDEVLYYSCPICGVKWKEEIEQ